MKKYTKRKSNKITLRAYAKINLSLDVLGKLPNGYHQVEMIMQAVELYDKITIEWERRGEGQRVEAASNLPYLPVGEENIACRAARLMLQIYKPREAALIRIHLEKHIPVAAGLAGGSTDAAAVLRGLARLWGLNLSLAELCSLGERLGADVPFCLWAQEGLTCALARGLGTELTALPPLDCLVLLSKPPISVSTAKVYGKLDLSAIRREQRPNTSTLAAGLESGSAALGEIVGCMKNVLETVTLTEFPRVRETKEKVLETGGAAAAMMSGSGPTVFGLYEEEDTARSAYEAMRAVNRETYLRRTYLG